MYLKTLPHLLLRDESAWSVSQWSRNSYSKFLEKKITPPQHLVINIFLAVVARKERVLHSELGLFGYLCTLARALLLVLFVQMQIIFLYKCFIISCACLQHTAPLQQQKVQQQRPCQPKKKHTNLYAYARTHTHTQTHYSLVHRKFCIKHTLAGCPGQGVPNMPAAVWLCHWYKTRLLCVCTSAVRQHTTPCASVRKWNSCDPNQISSSQPQRALKLLKVPDLHLHLLSFQIG